MQLLGIHHVTAITGHAPQNVAFYTKILGMRLVKKTVNQDDVSAYHLFYGDEVGHPGTELTFFDWPDTNPNRRGSGTIGGIGLRVAYGALDWWAEHVRQTGIQSEPAIARGTRRTLAFSDPEGQRFILTEDEPADRGTPWGGGPVPSEFGIRGLGPITLVVARPEPTTRVLTQIMGFRQEGEYAAPEDQLPMRVFATAAGGPGTEVHLAVRPDMDRGFPGIGGVHHVAFRTPDPSEQLAWRERIVEAGLHATEVIDRFYFKSVYFREPGGILFEIATDGPGFTSDEDVAHLGERLALPPFLEPDRRKIEAGLQPLDTIGDNPTS